MQRTNGRTKDFTEHTEMDDVVVPSGNNFSTDGSLEEQKEKERKERASRKPNGPLSNTGSGRVDQPNETCRQTKAKISNRTRQQEENAKKERKRQKRYEARIQGDSTAAHVNFDRSLPSGAAARHDHLNTLGGATIPRADSSTVTAMLKPIRER